ncbi:Asp-tRNA(Asn)/Glu-tRNA(Gln) amidotransferase subunit GatB [Anaerosalibacter massiliensis]|uniref:Aspartyl/glutamyl-tRNA(Asn/Gln) amidotransferase subunit B n=1 Tax=Anaerosalibacter massiliensis TaxID=1347392 RepID=A0A9X2MJF2_9FIRM|nr:Asp-tRNA(Asn)/Glu-tRNA(Gln) amidotransferase subunit GatB [Anaerosalibacter massiliensis]MCR2044618.1 Asp-tRNA(Asn)/Glu-tRNA(Gln) amidotransferase subunit GatB [Anaerosalibacter massiliensis]
MAYKTIIGLEIHSELMTNSKIFCNCTTEFGGDINTHCCPVCLGLPGALPVINKKVVEYGIRAGIAFHSDIARETKMDRKNYFYPDLVKGYQISQDNIPLCSGGFIEVEKKDGPKEIRIRRIHIEEDTGKSVHSEDGGSLLDYNRSGVPLIEIVTEPDMNSPEEVKEFLEKLKATLEYIEVSDVKMEEGSLRCDVNINVVEEETGVKTSITELKNLNSFKAVVKALEYEEKRHIELLKEGKENLKETRRWDEVNNETIVMRIKEGAADYRYFPEPDLVKMEIEEEWIESIKKNLPELPHDKKERFMKEYDIPEYDAGVLTQSKYLAAFYEETVKYSDDPKQVSNWIMGDVLRRINDEEIEIKDLKFTSKDLGELLKLIEDGKISNNIGKKVLRDMFDTGKSPSTIVKEKGLIQISDEGALKEIVEKVIKNNEQSIMDYKNGKDRALGFLVGQVMKETRGKANPQLANKLILEIINEK